MVKNTIIITVVLAALLFFIPFVWGKTNIGPGLQTYNSFTLKMTETGDLITLTPEEYLIGCLYAQIPPNYHPEALKAQAVAAHTYALRFIRDNTLNPDLSTDGAQLSDDARTFQPYYNEQKAREYYKEDYDLYYKAINEAAIFGAKHAVLFAGEPICAVYHNISSGVTNTPESVWGLSFPYLKSVNSSWDKSHTGYLCQNEITLDDIKIMFLKQNRETKIPESADKWFAEPIVNDGGYVGRINIDADVFSGGDIWRILNLRSPAFTVTRSGDIFSFETKGYGHGVGLSQYGADYMANKGYTAHQILSYYYSGIEIKKIK
ncbi:MAG: SpoIID/LytB domain-containing protein [Eubacterium sp.]|jgi:stage II sporulation protein D|nr:SpoIID/LytB domain-containing protein [Eubacterium sp.]